MDEVLWQAGSVLDPRLPTSHDLPDIGTGWVYEVDDVRKTFAELKARGVKFVDAQPREEWWGFSADLVDPDGNYFTINRTAVYSYFRCTPSMTGCTADGCPFTVVNDSASEYRAKIVCKPGS